MAESTPGLVGIVREFFEAHQLMRGLFARFRAGELRFAELGPLIDGDESSVLFRLKERCHALFRSDGPGGRAVRHRELLFDLAVGSLFHEAMKFRESFYQTEVYGPRVRALRDEAGAEAKSLFQEFERMLAAGTARLHEGLQECEALLARTSDQLQVLLELHRANALVVRTLVEHPELVREVFGRPLETLLAALHGDAATGYALAGESYLESGYYAAAGRTFAEALERGGDRERYEALGEYARGMEAYLGGHYADSVEHLGRWLDADAPGSSELRTLAQAAVSRVGQLALGPDREQLVRSAGALAERLGGTSEARAHTAAADAPMSGRGA
jgi:tetratricopeptide (TPR) repeat protein